MTIAIPYLHSEAVWDELVFTVRSICAHFKSPFKILLVGDPHPKLNLDVIPCERIKCRNFAKAADSIAKMRTIISSDLVTSDFLYWYDDIVLLRDIDLNFFKTQYCQYDFQNVRRSRRSNYHINLVNTYEVLRSSRLPTYSFETHLPKLFNKAKMKVILDKFTFRYQQVLINSLYLNFYLTEKPVHLRLDDNIKAGFYGDPDPYGFGSNVNPIHVIKDKVFLNYSNKGLTPQLKSYIISQFKSRCIYEK